MGIYTIERPRTCFIVPFRLSGEQVIQKEFPVEQWWSCVIYDGHFLLIHNERFIDQTFVLQKGIDKSEIIYERWDPEKIYSAPVYYDRLRRMEMPITSNFEKPDFGFQCQVKKWSLKVTIYGDVDRYFPLLVRIADAVDGAIFDGEGVSHYEPFVFSLIDNETIGRLILNE